MTYVDETGHYILGEFYTLLLSNPNYEEVFGDPITEAVIEDRHRLHGAVL